MDEDRISRAANAAEQLCSALWEAVHEEIQAGKALEVVALTDRIAEVCRSVSAAAGTAGSGAGRAAERGRPEVDEERPQAPADARFDGPLGMGDRPAALIDEHEGAATPIAIRDVRVAEGTAWAEAIGRRLERYGDDRVPFAVLLIEVLDLERLRVAMGPGEAHRQIREVEGAIVEQLRPADALLRESDGRYWLIAPQTDGTVAGALAQRIASATRRATSHRGVPLEVSLGIALCPEHGVDAAALTAHADIDLYAAEAEGRRLRVDDDRPIV